jgi:hypothetical protein
MASLITTAGKNAMLEELADLGLYMALYTNADGTTEVSGGSPAYARKAITWAAASSGALATGADVVFDVPAGTTVRAIGICSALTGGTQYAVDEPSTVETWAGQGTCTIASGTGFVITLT